MSSLSCVCAASVVLKSCNLDQDAAVLCAVGAQATVSAAI